MAPNHGRLQKKALMVKRTMERQILHIRLTNKKINNWMRTKTKLSHIATQLSKLKSKLACHTLRTERQQTD